MNTLKFGPDEQFPSAQLAGCGLSAEKLTKFDGYVFNLLNLLGAGVLSQEDFETACRRIQELVNGALAVLKEPTEADKAIIAFGGMGQAIEYYTQLINRRLAHDKPAHHATEILKQLKALPFGYDYHLKENLKNYADYLPAALPR